MQAVSENWKSVHRRSLLNEAFVEVSLDLADPDALADVSAEDNGAIYFSDSSRVVSGVALTAPQYCTLEQNMWVLDDSRKVLTDDYAESGYVGDVLSNDLCAFSEKIPTITLEFTRHHNKEVPGVTITWSSANGEYASDFIVTAYSSGVPLAKKEVIGNKSVTSLVMMDISIYNRIVIQVTKWCLPNRRARVEEVFVGVKKVYTKSDLFSYSHSHSIDPFSFSLPKNEIRFAIDNVSGEFDPNNEHGMSKYLMERQEVKTRYGLKMDDGTVEWIDGGTFYLSEWSAKQNGLTAEFAARDLLEFMSDTYVDSHNGSIRTLYNMAERVFEAANLPLNRDGSVKWVIDESLEGKETMLSIPEDTLSACLQLIANAGKCVIRSYRDGTIHIEPEENSTFYRDYSIDSSNSYSHPESTLSKPISRVKVKYGDGSDFYDFDNGGNGDTLEIDNPILDDVALAESVGNWLIMRSVHRQSLDLSWRADVRLDPMDVVTVTGKSGTHDVRMTEVTFTYNGAFRGKGKGTVMI